MAREHTARFIFVLAFVLNCLLWSSGRYGQPMRSDLTLVSRISNELSGRQVYSNSDECHPLVFPLELQCQHVDADCPSSDTVLALDYLHYYFCPDVPFRPLIFAGLFLWLIFLFSTLGISASDFFTPNLATIAQLLGLDENVAGVTFLAFGNGSPDVFSTFSAMHADSGNLALGEQLGAASFIVSCVVGSMCIIKPFQVHRKPFLRDVGFFTLAVGLVVFTLWDGEISKWEAGSLVVLYFIYVLIVVIGTWWERRREKEMQRIATLRAEYAEPAVPYTDEPPPNLFLTPASPTRTRAISAPDLPRLQINTASSRSASVASSRVAQLPSFSLIGALEFRDVVASLKRQAAGTTLGAFESPVTPYAGGHYHTHIPRSRASSSRQSSVHEGSPNGVRLGSRPQRPRVISAPVPHSPYGHQDLLSTENDNYFSDSGPTQTSLPSILRTPASPTSTTDEVEMALVSKRLRVWSAVQNTYYAIFPTLHNFHNQTILSKIACLLAAPAVLCLTLTLPVVVTPFHCGHVPEKFYNGDDMLVGFEEDGQARILIAEEEVEESMHELSFSKWLMACQCVLGPLFCVEVLFGGTKHEFWFLLGTLVVGLSVGILVVIFADNGDSKTGRMARCSMGFVVSIVWIMAIADEVVNVLKTFGYIFGLSDAIIGLTIFAVGNSLADLVANTSVAVFAPIMGFSACFGGPMLNILIGIGASGSYIIHQTSQPYILNLSTTLFVSSFGLLFILAATLIYVPLNDYYLTRKWGALLIAAYIIVMIINVVVELKNL